MALKKHGYMKSGAFKPLPKKGSAAYKEVKKTHEMLKKKHGK